MRTYQQLIHEMGKSETHGLESRLAVIIEHSLKVNHITGQASADNRRGWKKSIKDQLAQLTDLIDDNPGLKPKITESLLDKVYRSVVADLKKDYPAVPFPRFRQLSIEEILGSDVAAMLRK